MIIRFSIESSFKLHPHALLILTRDAEPQPEPPEPTHFGRSRSRSRSRRNGLLGAGAGAGAVKNGAAPAPKRDALVAKKKRNINSEITRNSWTNSSPMFFINNFRTSALNYLNFLDSQNHAFAIIWKSNKFFYQVRSCHWPRTSSRANSPSDIKCSEHRFGCEWPFRS